MGTTSKIEWTEATWNPWHGCHKVSAGCKNCYMFREKKHYGQDPNVVVRSKTKFYDPLKWKEPKLIFTCSWSDFFIEEADAWRDEAFAIMALTPQHTYQVLTKRPERMLEYLENDRTPGRIAVEAIRLRGDKNITFPDAEFLTEPLGYGDPGAEWYPLKNVWLGVSAEDQKTADERIPLLLQTPAARRFLSIEPLLGPVRIDGGLRRRGESPRHVKALITRRDRKQSLKSGASFYLGDPVGVDWVIVGGESGPEARPTHPDWIRSLRDQCVTASVPFFFKQWGEWAPSTLFSGPNPWRYGKGRFANWIKPLDDGGPSFWREGTIPGGTTVLARIGKDKAGRELDGRTWDEMPETAR